MSVTQDVQRGIIMMFFIHALLLLIVTISKLIRNGLDPVQEGEGAAYEDNAASHERIDADPNFDHVAVRK
jgi:hypothetical protein